MNKITFIRAFEDAVEIACQFAEKSLNRKLSREVIIKMYGVGTNGLEVSPAEFLDKFYINENLFHRLIDVMVVEVRGETPILFARISGHPPDQLSKCWNGEQGPFKQLEAVEILQQ